MAGNQVLSALGSGFRIFTSFGNSYRVAQYLQDVTPESCLEDLNEALSVKTDKFEHLEDIFDMFSATASTGSKYWDQASFAKYLKAKHPDNPALESCAPLLWRCFSYHAYLPFSQQRSSTKAAGESDHSSIDLKAFQRATTLLVLKGVDLLGTSKHGDRILPQSQYSRYQDERPRLAKLMFNGLSVPTEEVQLGEETSPDASPDLYARPEQEIFDTLISIQPCDAVHPSSDAQTRVHAQRLLELDTDPHTMSEPCRILQRNDLKAVMQLLLLVRVTKQLWAHDTYPPCEDVHYAHLVSDSAEVARAAKLASVLIEHLPGNGDNGVDWPYFRNICTSSFVSRRSHASGIFSHLPLFQSSLSSFLASPDYGPPFSPRTNLQTRTSSLKLIAPTALSSFFPSSNLRRSTMVTCPVPGTMSSSFNWTYRLPHL